MIQSNWTETEFPFVREINTHARRLSAAHPAVNEKKTSNRYEFDSCLRKFHEVYSAI
jgi:hypothetical protein